MHAVLLGGLRVCVKVSEGLKKAVNHFILRSKRRLCISSTGRSGILSVGLQSMPITWREVDVLHEYGKGCVLFDRELFCYESARVVVHITLDLRKECRIFNSCLLWAQLGFLGLRSVCSSYNWSQQLGRKVCLTLMGYTGTFISLWANQRMGCRHWDRTLGMMARIHCLKAQV